MYSKTGAATAGAAGGRRDGPATQPWRGKPLPRGRHKVRPEAVRADQRERLLRAMVECVATDGYAAATVPKVVAAARVSPNTFYELFDDREDCFLAVVEEETGMLLDELVRRGVADDWVEAVRAGLRVYLGWWRARPEATRAYCVELPAAGGRALGHRHLAHRRFLAMFEALADRVRLEQPGLPAVSRVALRVLIAGISELVAEEVRADRLERLGELEDELVRLIVQVLADDETADRAVARAPDAS